MWHKCVSCYNQQQLSFRAKIRGQFSNQVDEIFFVSGKPFREHVVLLIVDEGKDSLLLKI
jgi:hypothetical protein